MTSPPRSRRPRRSPRRRAEPGACRPTSPRDRRLRGADLGARYEELEPTFLGFDERHAYWRDATGSGRRWRWDVETHRTERAEVRQDVEEATTAPVGKPWDPARGREVWVEDGCPVRDPSVVRRGSLSPDGPYLVSEPRRPPGRHPGPRRTPVRLVTDRFAWFGGWQGDTRFYALTRVRYEDGYDPSRPDRTRGTLVSCVLASARCATIRPVTATGSVVLAGASEGY